MATLDLVIGVDVGTSGCKVSVVSRSGRVVSRRTAGYVTRTVRPGWAEQRPDAWVTAAHKALTGALADLSGPERASIRAVGFTAPTHVAVLEDSAGRPVRPAIMWNDQRSAAEARELASSDVDVIGVAGNAPAPMWTMCQLMWLHRNEPETLRRAQRIVLMKDYVRRSFGVRGPNATDRVDAEGTLLWDAAHAYWSPALLELAGVSGIDLPVVRPPSAVVDMLDPDLGRQWRLPLEIPLVVGTTDTAAEVLACGGTRAGAAVVKLATAGNVALVRQRRTASPRVVTYSHPVPGLCYENHATMSAAESLTWVRTQLLGSPGKAAGHLSDNEARDLDDQVSGVRPGCDGLLFHPYLHGERAPLWDAHVRASFLGVTARHTRPHLLRAVMEGVAFSLRDALGPVRLAGPVSLVGGGARSRTWAQIVSDVLDVDLSVVVDADSSTGAAWCAAVGVGWFGTLDAISTAWPARARQITPRPAVRDLYSGAYGIYIRAREATRELSYDLAAMADAAPSLEP
jgi:xylulokinase